MCIILQIEQIRWEKDNYIIGIKTSENHQRHYSYPRISGYCMTKKSNSMVRYTKNTFRSLESLSNEGTLELMTIGETPTLLNVHEEKVSIKNTC